MSRSYKHTPIAKSKSGRVTKKQANKRLRQKMKDLNFEIGNFMYYKTITESYDIADYKCYYPEDKTIYRK